MRLLDWKYFDNGSTTRVLTFNDKEPKEIDYLGILMISDEYGKVLIIHYGNIQKLYKHYKNISMNTNELDIRYFTYTEIFPEDDIKNILNILTLSLYHNEKFYEVKGKVKLPMFCLYQVYKTRCFVYKEEDLGYKKFLEINEILEKNELSTKVECFLTLNKISKKFILFIRTTSYFEREFKIFSKIGHPSLDNNWMKLENDLLQKFGEIIDFPPVIYSIL